MNLILSYIPDFSLIPDFISLETMTTMNYEDQFSVWYICVLLLTLIQLYKLLKDNWSLQSQIAIKLTAIILLERSYRVELMGPLPIINSQKWKGRYTLGSFKRKLVDFISKLWNYLFIRNLISILKYIFASLSKLIWIISILLHYSIFLPIYFIINSLFMSLLCHYLIISYFTMLRMFIRL